MEALDGFAAAMVARLEHQITRAATTDALAGLRRQLAAAQRLEATTSAAVEQARQCPAVAEHRPESGLPLSRRDRASPGASTDRRR